MGDLPGEESRNGRLHNGVGYPERFGKHSQIVKGARAVLCAQHDVVSAVHAHGHFVQEKSVMPADSPEPIAHRLISGVGRIRKRFSEEVPELGFEAVYGRFQELFGNTDGVA